jgi:hypothetical protein
MTSKWTIVLESFVIVGSIDCYGTQFLDPNVGIKFFLMNFCIIKCNFDITHLLILIMYDVQYNTTTYGFKINWIFVFVNHKRITCVLDALVLTFDGVHFGKVCGFINFLPKLNMYISSSRCKNIKNSKKVMFSFFFEFFYKFKKLCYLLQIYFCQMVSLLLIQVNVFFFGTRGR